MPMQSLVTGQSMKQESWICYGQDGLYWTPAVGWSPWTSEQIHQSDSAWAELDPSHCALLSRGLAATRPPGHESAGHNKRIRVNSIFQHRYAAHAVLKASTGIYNCAARIVTTDTMNSSSMIAYLLVRRHAKHVRHSITNKITLLISPPPHHLQSARMP